ncbi:hypothetical protein [Streptomyces narbonensis]|uniref:hypothetical protein n=1 Tax=Streptomyces narbonensis TaxID=67333 RepID=UPI0033C368C6
MNCEICAMWNDMDGHQIINTATHVGHWGDGKTVLLCQGCVHSGAGRGNGSPTLISDYYWQDAVTDLIIARLERQMRPGVSLAKTAATRLRTSIAQDLRANHLDALAELFNPETRDSLSV